MERCEIQCESVSFAAETTALTDEEHTAYGVIDLWNNGLKLL